MKASIIPPEEIFRQIAEDTMKRMTLLRTKIAQMQQDAGRSEAEVVLLSRLDQRADQSLDTLAQIVAADDPFDMEEDLLAYAKYAITEMDTFEDNLPELQ